MKPSPLRCSAPRPDAPHLECHAKLADAMPGSVSVERGSEPPQGCVMLTCRRCGARYVVCPARGVREAA